MQTSRFHKKHFLNNPRRALRRGSSSRRPSFQGLSLTEGKTQSLRNVDSHRSLDLSRSAKLEQIQVIRETTVDNASAGLVVDATPEEHLQAVMTKAKESGLSVDKIFGYFQSADKEVTQINTEAFLKGLKNLGEDISMAVTFDQMAEFVKKFDVNGNGMISLAEFKMYCLYKIPAVAWKVEQKQLEETGQMLKITDQLRDGRDSSTMKTHPCGDEVHKSTKLFWRTMTNVDLSLFYCKSLGIITMQLFDDSLGKELQLLYVRKSDCVVDRAALEEAVTRSLSSSFLLREEEGTIKEKEEWNLIGKFLSARLELKPSPSSISSASGGSITDTTDTNASQLSNGTPIPYVCKRPGDASETLMLQKPINLENPPPIIAPTRPRRSEIERAIAGFDKASKEVTSRSHSAEAMANLVGSALDKISEM